MRMNHHFPAFSVAGLRQRVRGMFNLNDPRWGRGGDQPAESDKPEAPRTDPEPPLPPSGKGRAQGSNQGPPDLDELWRDFNRKLGGLFGGGRGGGRGGDGGGSGGFKPPEMKNAGLGVGLIAGVVMLIWLGTGFFIVQEGQQAVITQFGRYHSTVGAGFNWRLPYPVQRHEIVVVTQIRSVDVGRDNIVKATGLRDSAMLTADQNIVEIKFAVQYRLSDARAYLFESKDPANAVVQAAESAVREVVGRMTMEVALGDERDQIAVRVRERTQAILDVYKVGVDIVGINLQQTGVRPPEQVQAAFDDVLKAGQERERAKNEAQAYANDVIPRAVGAASRLREESEAYRARIVAQAQGDAQRFRSVLTEYQKAPQVTRERMFIDAMQQVYSNVSKVLIDSRAGSNLLYLPLDKIMQAASTSGAAGGQNPPAPVVGAPAPAPATQPASPPATTAPESRSRDAARNRDREAR